MKKDRNAFFQNQSASSYFYPTSSIPYMNTYPMATESNSNYYQGPVIPVQNNGTDTFDYESRIAKLERQINRLDARVNKLENEISVSNLSTTNEYNASNMYMV